MSRPVLARVLNCDPRHLGQQVIVPLAREAATSGGSVLLTRHRRIAEAAVAIMVEEYGEDMADRFVDLARAAKVARECAVIPQYARWEYDLPDHFIGKSSTTAIRVAQALLDANRDDSKLAVNLARICRKCDEPKLGTDALATFTDNVGDNRSFWYEWGTCAGNAGDHAVSALLGGWSLADQAAASPPDTKQAKLSLAGLGVAFRELYKQYHAPHFIAGLGAVAYLGQHLPLDEGSRRYFAQHKKDADAEGTSTADPAQALEQLGAALLAAWEVCGKREELAARISPPGAMKFTGLARLFTR